MNRMWWGVLTGLLLLPPLGAQDQPKDGTPREQYQALVQEIGKRRSEILQQARKVKGEEQQKLFAQYRDLGESYAEKFYKLAEAHAQDPVAVDALFWVVQNGRGSASFVPALTKVKAEVAKMPLPDLLRRVRPIFGNEEIMEAVYARAEKEEQADEAAQLLGWIATSGGHLAVGQKAVDRLVTKHGDHAAVESACLALARSRSPQAAATLQKILETAQKPNIRAAAALSLAQLKVGQIDRLGNNPAEADKVAAEAEKLYNRVINEFGKDAVQHKATAERELKGMAIRPGKEAPEITAADLDGKEFKLSDYRGKVVLLDFWGHW